MSPEGPRLVPSENLYTIVLAAAFCAVLATVIFVAFKCYFQFGTIFTVS